MESLGYSQGWGSILLVVVLTSAPEASGITCLDQKRDCYMNGKEGCTGSDIYQGKKSHTRSGTACQSWASHSPWNHSVSGTKSQCQNIDNAAGPWCYTMDLNVRWDYCFDTCPETEMKTKIFDPAGMPSPLSYDRGTIIITCSVIDGAKRFLKIINVSSKSDLVSNTTNQISYSLKITGSLSGQSYECKDGDRYIDSITISNVFCDPTRMPTKFCNKPGEYCQRAASGKDICTTVNWHNCKFPTKFPVNCPSAADSSSNTCTLLDFLATSTVTYLSSSKSGCSPQVQLELVISDNHTQTLMMSDWTYVDVTKLNDTSILGRNLRYKTFTYQCKAMVNRTIIFDESHEFSKNDGVWNMSNLKKAIMNLSKPTNIYISCSGVDDNRKDNTAFSTQLLAFRSDDLKVLVTERKRFITANEVIIRVIARATAVDGLHVCLQEHDGICIPSEPNIDATAESNIACGRHDKSCVATFYAGLFGSSPKQMYIPIYNKTVAISMAGSATPSAGKEGSATPSADKERSATPSADKGGHTITWMTSALIVMGIVCLVSVALAVVMGVLWHKSGQGMVSKARRDSTKRTADTGAKTRRRSSTMVRDDVGASQTEFNTTNMSNMEPATTNRSQW